VVQEFNKGVYDYIIATDESGGRGEEDAEEEEVVEENGSDAEKEDEPAGGVEEMGSEVTQDDVGGQHQRFHYINLINIPSQKAR
jgi:hypothetical protein